MTERRERLSLHIPERVREAFRRLMPRRNANSLSFTELELIVVPNPSEDPDGFDRNWILRNESEAFNGGRNILTPEDLTKDVLDWARANYPESYSTQAIRLHYIIEGWRRTQQNVSASPAGWKELLSTTEWTKYVPASDFSQSPH